jgi:glyceraldehyde 3-phosphate dehydrogenase
VSKDTIIALHAEHQGRWKNREEIAEHMIALIGQLYREKKYRDFCIRSFFS